MTGRVFRAQNLSGAEFMAIGPAVRLVRQVQIAMLVSIALCAVAGEMLAGKLAHDPANALFHALSFISISIVGATVVVRRTLVLPSEALLKERSDDTVAVARWRTGYLFLYALCEMLGVFRTHSADGWLYSWQRLGLLSGRLSAALAVFSASAAC